MRKQNVSCVIMYCIWRAAQVGTYKAKPISPEGGIPVHHGTITLRSAPYFPLTPKGVQTTA